jgi:hypothetical protein
LDERQTICIFFPFFAKIAHDIIDFRNERSGHMEDYPGKEIGKLGLG